MILDPPYFYLKIFIVLHYEKYSNHAEMGSICLAFYSVQLKRNFMQTFRID